jgi:hypothetical protein
MPDATSGRSFTLFPGKLRERLGLAVDLQFLVDARDVGAQGAQADAKPPVVVSCVLSRRAEPQERLREYEIAADFLVSRIRREFPPQVEILRLAEREAGEKQSRLPRRPTVPGLHVRFKRPLRLVGEERVEIRLGFADAAPIGQPEGPEVVSRRRQHLAQGRQVIELED